MASNRQSRAQSSSVKHKLGRIQTDPSHHLTGGLDFNDNSPTSSPRSSHFRQNPKAWHRSDASQGLWSDLKTLRWVVRPSSSFKMLLVPIVCYINWELLAPYVSKDIPNPFAPLLFISHPIESSSPHDPRYQKGYLDLVFLAYYVVFWSFVRQIATLYACLPLARWYGIKKEAKLDRFGEQGYSLVYWGIMGFWGWRIMGQLPTWWYNTQYFWIDYPHWDMKPELKRYYLMQAAFWAQQLLVLIFRLEKPRKDYYELVVHHFVTLWLIGWSYLINLTLIGNAVYMSMDIPDTLLAFSKLLNYMGYDKPKVVSFAIFICGWTYFRHYLNIMILWSVWTEFDLMPATSMRWFPESGAWLAPWMQYQVFLPILLLQCLNLFWYYFIIRILVRAVTGSEVDDVRSDDEGDENDKKD